MGQQQVVIGLTEIPNLLGRSETAMGEYNLFLEQIPAELELLFLPPARADREFEKAYVDCLFPASTAAMEVTHPVLQSEAVSVVSAYLFRKSPNGGVASNGLPVIAVRHGLSFGEARKRLNANFVETSGPLQSLNLLMKGRVTHALSYLPDMTGAARRLNVPVPYYDSQGAVYSAEDAFVCKDTEQNRVFLTEVNAFIIQWRLQREQSLSNLAPPKEPQS
ncbi:hypothetical protein OCL06_12100 [Alteromonas sp. ASW11-19]|uniref:LysR substrate-binding domain-containing protein n=1 Tax=Alteromonas salexigens TaxID=2982530 RepID=A0ABT2VTZ8_9ALTE|nr:hypothetical protein [Alteromonas salexigens]MCU7555329.1 hypothetical protein [Alteromonas salexigens]